MKPKIKLVLIMLLLGLLFTQTASAALVPCGKQTGASGRNPCTLPELVTLAISLINYLYFAAAFVALAVIFWGFWGLLTSGGNEEKIKAAKDTLTNGIIGFVIIAVSYILIDFVVMAFSGKVIDPTKGFNISDLIKFIKQ